jgi:hypothetical protein
VLFVRQIRLTLRSAGPGSVNFLQIPNSNSYDKKAFSLHYEEQRLNIVYRNNPCLMWGSYETYEHNV